MLNMIKEMAADLIHILMIAYFVYYYWTKPRAHFNKVDKYIFATVWYAAIIGVVAMVIDLIK